MTTIGSIQHYSGRNYYCGGEKANAAKNSDAFGGHEQTASQANVNGRPSKAATKFQELPGNTVDRSNLGFVGYSWELPAEDYQRILTGAQNSLTFDYKSEPEMPDFSNYAGTNPYADIVLGGEVIATIDNQGMVGANDDRLAERLRGLSESISGANGPDLAQKLAQQIAKLLGGRVHMADTALTQSQFDALPPPAKPTVTIDYDGMKADPRYDKLEFMMQKRAEYMQQQAGTNIVA